MTYRTSFQIPIALLLICLPMLALSKTFPLSVSDNDRYLVSADGEPFYFVGDTHWPLFWHYSFEDAKRIVDDRVEKGFSAILLTVAAFENRPNRYGHATFSDRSNLQVDERYFDHADRVLDYIGSKNMAVYAVALWWNQYHDDGNLSQLKAYGEWLGARWKDRDNLIWIIGGDQPFTEKDRPSFRALAESIKDGGGAQIMSWHPHAGYPMLSAGHSSSEYLHEESWLDFSSVQAHAHGGRMVERMRDDYRRMPTKPTIMIEPWYFWTETRDPVYGFPIHERSEYVRRSHYQTRIGGGSFGEGYGAWPFWFHASKREEWLSALENQEAAVQIGTHMRNAFLELPWWLLEPDFNEELLVSGAGFDYGWDRAVAAKTADHSVAVVYVPTAREIEIELSNFDAPIEGVWIDPTSGAHSERVELTNTRQRLQSPSKNGAGDEDFLLVLRSK